MRSTTLAAVVALTFGQASDSRGYAGTWIAELAGKTYVRLEVTLVDDALGGRISLGNIEVDSHGVVTKAESAPRELTPIFDLAVRGSTLLFSLKEGEDTDRFEMRLLGAEAAELRFLLSDADLSEAAASGVAVPKPVRLKKIGLPVLGLR